MFNVLLHSIGTLRSTIHSTKQHAEEISNTLNLLRLAIHQTLTDDFNTDLKSFLEEVQNTKRTNKSKGSSPNSDSMIKLRRQNNVGDELYKYVQTAFQGESILFYQIMFIGSTRFTTTEFSHSKKNDDSCILYRMNMDLHVGFINQIIFIDQNVFLKIRTVEIKEYLNYSCESKVFHCKNIIIGATQCEENDLFIKPDDVIEKLIHYQESKNRHFFFRFPTLMESS